MDVLFIGKSGASLRSLESIDFEKRNIHLTGEITAEMAERICMQLQYLDYVSNDEITLYINSPGGSVSAGFAIYDCLRQLKSNVKFVATGECMSMAAVLLCLGKKGYRCATKNCELMLHEPLTSTSGNASHLQIQIERISKLKNKIVCLLAEATGQDEEYISHILERDHFISSKEALSMGVIDKVL